MKAGRKIRYSMAFLGLIILMAVLLAWNICAGSVNISVKEVTEVLFGEKTAQTASRIVWEIRLPWWGIGAGRVSASDIFP